MKRTILGPIHNEKVNPKLLKTPIADAFDKVERITEVEVEADLKRKRQEVKSQS